MPTAASCGRHGAGEARRGRSLVLPRPADENWWRERERERERDVCVCVGGGGGGVGGRDAYGRGISDTILETLLILCGV